MGVPGIKIEPLSVAAAATKEAKTLEEPVVHRYAIIYLAFTYMDQGINCVVFQPNKYSVTRVVYIEFCRNC